MANLKSFGRNNENCKRMMSNMILSEDELVEFFSNYFPSLHVNSQDLKVPKSDRIMTIYEAFLSDFGISSENLAQPPMIASNAEFVEHHGDTIFSLNFYIAVRNVLSSAGFDNFIFKDLIDPRPKKTRLIMSLLKNFWEYVNIAYNEYLEHKESMMNELESCKEQIHKIESFRERINNIQVEKAERAPQIREHEEYVHNLEQRISEQCEIKKSIQSEVDGLKMKIVQLKNEVAEFKVTSVKLREDDEELSKRIIQSPEKEERYEQKLIQNESEEKNRKEEKREKMYEVSNFVTRLKKIKIELDNALSLVKSTQVIMDNRKEIQDEVMVLDNFKNEKSDSVQSLQNELKRSQRLITIKKETISRLQMQQPRKVAALKSSIENLEQELSNLKEKHSQCSVVKTQQIETLTEINENIQQNEQHIEEVKNEVRLKFTDLMKKVGKRHTECLEYLATNKAEFIN